MDHAVRAVVAIDHVYGEHIPQSGLRSLFAIGPPPPPSLATAFEGLGLGGILDAPLGPAPKLGAVSVNGRLPPEVVQRIVRQQSGRFRLCYGNGLRNNPKLAGRVVVKFVIDRTGAVSTAADGGSDLPDKNVVTCVVRAFGNMSFPQPEGGIVTVVYPLVFQSA
jgi:hypothetical protein